MTWRTLRAARKHLAGRRVLSWPALMAVVLARAGFAGSATYPLMAAYNGTGSVDVASSYHAALPPVPFGAHID
jgi:hypothetical protein